VRTRDVLAAGGGGPRVTMQVFQKQDACLGGSDEAIAILKSLPDLGLRLGGPRGRGLA
jgi:hypothetical protein